MGESFTGISPKPSALSFEQYLQGEVTNYGFQLKLLETSKYLYVVCISCYPNTTSSLNQQGVAFFIVFEGKYHAFLTKSIDVGSSSNHLLYFELSGSESMTVTVTSFGSGYTRHGWYGVYRFSM